MIAPLAKLIDWSAIQALAMLTPHDYGRNPRLEEALEFLKGPDFIPAESQPALLEFNPDESGLHFHFPTPRPGEFAENNIVYGRLYRYGENWRERPVLVLLHGRGDFFNHWHRFPSIARRCNRAGFNAATLVAPCYFQRCPRRSAALGGPDYLRLAKTTAQAVAEIRALTGWLLGQGCPTVALWGISYSGWLAGLTVCHDMRLAAVVLSIPGVRLYPFIEERAIWRSGRETLPRKRAALEALNLTALNLATIQPVIPKENILLIDAIHDLMVPKDVNKELWQAWGQPDLWQLPHGHISITCMTAPGFTGRVLRWLAPRLNKPGVRTGQTEILPH
jgi:pimeloyl-ACP methyl ester carboxylesterase